MTLVHLAKAGDVEGVLRELGALTPNERAAQAEALEARRAPMRAGWYHVPEEEKAAQLAAELGCRTDPVAAADWILRPENDRNAIRLPLGGAWMLEVVNLHPVAWRAELAAQLADRSTPGNSVRSDLVEHLVLDTGCPVPTSDGFIDSWLRWQRERDFTARLKFNAFSPAGELLRARLAEVVDIIKADAQPFLLAVPTDATGALDAAVLVRRLSVLDGLGITPAPVDLAQALLRVTPTADAKVLGAAGRLGSDAGPRLSRWLREGGLPHWESGPANWPDAHSGVHLADWVSHIRPEPAPGPSLLPPAKALIGPYRKSGLCDPMVPFWLAQLPHHRELVLTRDYFRYRVSMRGWAHALPLAAESGGPAGFALHLALAYTLTYDQQGERDAAVDALLVLAARGQLDTELLGQQLAGMLRGRGIEANRVTASLRTAAAFAVGREHQQRVGGARLGNGARQKAPISTAAWTARSSICRSPITGPQRRISAAGAVSNEEHVGSRTASGEVPAAAHRDREQVQRRQERGCAHRPQGRVRVRSLKPSCDGWADIPGAIGCTLENRLFRDAYDDFRAAGAEVRGVSTQRPDEQQVFAVEEGIPFTLLSDVDLRLAAALRLPVFRAGQALRLKRAVLVVDRERVVRQARFPVTDIPGAVREALAVVRRVAAGR